MYKVIRRVIQWTFFVLFSFSFLSFFSWESGLLSSILPKAQFYPALVRFSPLVIIYLVIALVFGRVYCSTICPLATIQDIFLKRGKRYKFRRLSLFKRYLIPVIFLILLISGFPAISSVFDPYSSSGRILATVNEVIIVPIHNFAASVLRNFSIYIISYPIEVRWVTITITLLTLVLLIVMTRKGGRLFCNTLCPVGAILSLPSKWSLLGFRIETSKCTSCGVCERACKAEAIDSKGKVIDNSKCITCFNCSDTCRFDALKYTSSRKKELKSVNSEKKHNSRRDFLKKTASGSLLFAALPTVAHAGNLTNESGGSSTGAIPPGSINKKSFLSNCTSCSLCITRCPGKVLQPSGITQYGITGVGVPYMDFNKGACDYECKLCSELCPNEAIKTITLESKKVTKIGEAKFIRKFCVVETDKTSCGACGEICPTGAIDMLHIGETPDGDLEIPVIRKEYCIGCGACQLVCPVSEKNAIFVQPYNTHTKAKKRETISIDSEESKSDDDGKNGFAF